MAYAQQIPTLIRARSMEQAEALDELLWEFDPDGFIGHQLAGDEDDDLTPVLIVPPEADSPLRALVINLRDDAVPGDPPTVKEVVAADPAERSGSRTRWSAYKARGFELRKFDM
jgi:DNA polymerase-3 subunit chi